jgi:hypothetical protein
MTNTTALPRRLLLALTLALMVPAANAQTQRLRGTIESVDGPLIRFKTNDGTLGVLLLTPRASVIAVVKATLADIQEGSFIASAARPQADGSQLALELRIFPESMRGAGEGHRPYAPVPNGTMTNGTTTSALVSGVNGSVILVKHKDGETKIVIPPGAPILRYVEGTAADLLPGAGFTVNAATPRAEGGYQSSRISVGRNGVLPP